MLYLVSTPIGNLEDLSFRAVRVLQECDYLLCEDTRRSSILLNHYGIRKPLESYHKFNEKQKLSKIIKDLKEGVTIALLSDGGSPLICDPGELLAKTCIEENIPFTTIPGPSALIQALSLSGLSLLPFQFLGFVPRKEGEWISLLASIFTYPGTSILYESPERLLSSLSTMATLSPSSTVAVARELTKTFEEVIRLPAKEAAAHFTNNPPRGEIVLLIEGNQDLFSSNTPEELVNLLQTTYNLPLPSAIKTAAHFLKLPKQTVYKIFHKDP